MAQIRITPQELRDTASFIADKRQSLIDEVEVLHTRINDMTANWEGAAQSAFVETFEKDLYPVLSKTMPEVLEGIMNQAKGAADTFEETDNKIADAFRGK